jgi:hypothetical protein
LPGSDQALPLPICWRRRRGRPSGTALLQNCFSLSYSFQTQTTIFKLCLRKMQRRSQASCHTNEFPPENSPGIPRSDSRGEKKRLICTTPRIAGKPFKNKGMCAKRFTGVSGCVGAAARRFLRSFWLCQSLGLTSWHANSRQKRPLSGFPLTFCVQVCPGAVQFPYRPGQCLDLWPEFASDTRRIRSGWTQSRCPQSLRRGHQGSERGNKDRRGKEVGRT